jgi:chaperonin GroES
MDPVLESIKIDLDDLQDLDNINDRLTEEQSGKIGALVKRTYQADKDSRARWETATEDATKLALQITEPKSYPWPDAANVKFPLITIASMQFAARAYPALVKAPDLVKFRVQGKDDGVKASRAARISSHMSYQLLEEDEPWEEHMDRALLALPILGCVFKKSYYDVTKEHNCSTTVLPKNLVVHYYARSIEECERKTEIFQLSPREIKERELRKIFTKHEYTSSGLPEYDDKDRRQGTTPPSADADSPRTLLEQHCYLDLDGDGYKEPYVVTIDRDTSKVLRIVNRFDKVTTEQSLKILELNKRIKALAEGLPKPQQGQPVSNQQLAQLQQAEATIQGMQAEIEQLASEKPKVLKIDAVEYYTKYSFIPSPDGGFYDLGFGALLSPLNDSVNTLINQLIDSGSMNNSSSGFIGRGARIKGGKVRFEPNEWKRVNVSGQALKDSIVPLPVNPPSPVLFQLLSLLISYAERVGSVTDAMVGENPGQNTPAYNMSAMLEQGLQVFNGIFKRVYRSMRGEFRKLYKLNSIYLDEESYFSYHDSDTAILRTDYTADPKDLIPAADPNAFSNKEKTQKAMMISERAQMVPGYNPIVVEKRWLEAVEAPDAEELYPTQMNPETGALELVFPPQPDPQLELDKAEIQRKTLLDKATTEIKGHEAEAKMMAAEAQVMRIQMDAAKAGDDSLVKRLELQLTDMISKREAVTKIALKEMDREIEREKIDGQKQIANKRETSTGVD